jgi:hypothetical protein
MQDSRMMACVWFVSSVNMVHRKGVISSIGCMGGFQVGVFVGLSCELMMR